MPNLEIPDIMAREVVSFRKETRIRDIARKMSEQRISCVVITEKKVPVGIITERDLIRGVIAEKKDPESVMAVDIMSFPVVTVTEEAGLIAVAQLMKKKGIRRVVVTKGDDLVGLITQTNLMEGMINKIKHLNWQLVHAEISLDEYLNSIKTLRFDKKSDGRKGDK